MNGFCLPGVLSDKDKNRCQRFNGELEVFEEKKREQVDQNAQPKEHFLPVAGTLVQTAAQVKGHQDGEEQEEKITAFSPEVKEQAGREEHLVAILFSGQKRSGQNNGEE